MSAFGSLPIASIKSRWFRLLVTCPTLIASDNVERGIEMIRRDPVAIRDMTSSRDPHLAEAHAALGYISTHFLYDWHAAELQLCRALTINPDY